MLAKIFPSFIKHDYLASCFKKPAIGLYAEIVQSFSFLRLSVGSILVLFSIFACTSQVVFPPEFSRLKFLMRLSSSSCNPHGCTFPPVFF